MLSTRKENEKIRNIVCPIELKFCKNSCKKTLN